MSNCQQNQISFVIVQETGCTCNMGTRAMGVAVKC